MGLALSLLYVPAADGHLTMKMHVYTLTCDLCGEEGGATPQAAADVWRGATVTHFDPRICRWNLDRQRAELEKTIAELREQAV